MSFHVVFDTTLNAFTCERCLVRQIIELPCSVQSFTAAADAFELEHAKCQGHNNVWSGRLLTQELLAELEEEDAELPCGDAQLRKVAQALGVSTERARQIEQEALAKMKAGLARAGIEADVVDYLDSIAPGHVEPPGVEYLHETVGTRVARGVQRRKR